MKTKRDKFLLIFLLFFSITFNFIHAEKITFSADRMRGNTGSMREYTKLEKNAVIKTETMEIKADDIELSGENYRFITATVNVSGKSTSSGFTFKCTKLKYDRKTKIVTLEGSVLLEDTSNNVTANAQLIEYNQNTDVAIMQIGVKLLSKESVCTSALAIYRKKEKIVELTGQPKVVRRGDTFRAQEITLDIETEEITLDGKVRGSVSE